MSVPAGVSFESLSACGSIEKGTGCGGVPALPISTPFEPKRSPRTRGFAPRYLSSQALISPPLLPTSALYKGVSTTATRSGGRGASFGGGGLVAGMGAWGDVAGLAPWETGASGLLPGGTGRGGSGAMNMNWYTINRPAISMAAMIARFSIPLQLGLENPVLTAEVAGRIHRHARDDSERCAEG